MRPKRVAVGVGKAAAVALILTWSLVPIAFILVSSFKPSADIFAAAAAHVCADGKAFCRSLGAVARLLHGPLNSAIVTAGATLLAVVASTIAGYAYSRFRSPNMAGTALFSLPSACCRRS